MVVTRDVVHSTKKRFKKFEKLKCSESNANGEFWDIVILTALDDIQKNVFETQLKKKIENKQIPFSQYYVVSDPPGYKIGNGGSTMVVLEFLFDKFGYEEIKSKKIIIIHAGVCGYAIWLPNLSDA
ncbi:fucose-1-phosphate guanylyltransferase-like [Clavelina lepadiformis]|uniref:fucose-1-phosphate guanylyltransferase-like n=1 Tax=Clavelina lepadiformis TaxID=159417 RepID=UPI0040418250